MNIIGNIENIIFRNENNGYTVLLVNTGETVFTLVGNITQINAGERLEADVSEFDHPQFGKQYRINNYNLCLPDEDADAVTKFLISLAVKGVGIATVSRITNLFGKDTLKTIKDTPEKLYGIKGLTEGRIAELHDKVLHRSNELDIIIELEKFGLTLTFIKRILDKYGEQSIEIIKENPYKLALEIEGIGFNTCDNIAQKLGFSTDDEKRIEALVIYVLESAYINGNVYLLKEELLDELNNYIDITNINISDILYDLEINLKVKLLKYGNKDYIFLKRAYNVEKKLSNILLEKKDYITIITGGPGTVKTYNIKKYLDDAFDKGLKVELCAPTGRAAKRINEVTGYNAKTIHRLLECVGDNVTGKSYFQRNEDNKLDLDVLIVDELSMVDEYLMLSLMKALPDMVSIILVGDVDQLPSVGAGQVLKDMIDSKLFNVKLLTEVHRQDEGSNIVINAHKVNEGKEVDLNIKLEDFVFTRISNEEKIKSSIKTLVKDIIPEHFNISFDQVQVICPSKKGNCGTEIINKSLQEALNPEDFTKDEIEIGTNIFRVGDKVMQNSNNYEIPYDVLDKNGIVIDRGSGIYNGDIGRIKEIDDENRSMIIQYDDREAYYNSKDLNDLSHAYAITVHKSQGSEYDVVIMPLSQAPIKLLTRKILYTAITRAKKCICFVGIEKYFHEMINNNNEIVRYSALCKGIHIDENI